MGTGRDPVPESTGNSPDRDVSRPRTRGLNQALNGLTMRRAAPELHPTPHALHAGGRRFEPCTAHRGKRLRAISARRARIA